MFFKNLDEDTVYEALVSSSDGNCFNIKPFGVQVKDNGIVLGLYPNHTLVNIKRTGTFDVHFTEDVLLYTKAALGLLDEDCRSLMDVSIRCEVTGYDAIPVEDSYGQNILTIIHANMVKIIENKSTYPTINRATNKIIELLVDYSRYDYQDIDALIEKLEKTDKFIQKNGNNKHKKSMELLKKRIIED